MYYHLTEATKRRFLKEIRRFWSYHPKYKDIVDHIQGKYSFRERPQYGIILKTSSANHVQLSADNFVGVGHSYVQLAKYPGKNGQFLEWIKEDSVAIQENGGVFPSTPGFYFIQITSPTQSNPAYDVMPQFEFMVDPLYDVADELATKIDDFTWEVEHPFLDGTTRVYEMPGRIPYTRGVNYTEDPSSGRITVTNPVPSKAYLSVSYRYSGESTGPWRVQENFTHSKAIPGVELAFGRRIEVDDVLCVVVHSRRQPSYLEYGGKWDLSLDFDVITRDQEAQMEIVDSTVMYIWGVLRNRLSGEGIEITAVSMGGESEEVADETGDDYFYNASFSVQTMTDWAIQVPLSAVIRQVSPLTASQVAQLAGLTDEELITTEVASNIQLVEDVGLQSFNDPFYTGYTATFETIK